MTFCGPRPCWLGPPPPTPTSAASTQGSSNRPPESPRRTEMKCSWFGYLCFGGLIPSHGKSQFRKGVIYRVRLNPSQTTHVVGGQGAWEIFLWKFMWHSSQKREVDWVIHTCSNGSLQKQTHLIDPTIKQNHQDKWQTTMDIVTRFFLHTAARNVFWNVVSCHPAFIYTWCREPAVTFILEPWASKPEEHSWTHLNATDRYKSLGFIMVHRVSSFVKYQYPMMPFMADSVARHCTFLQFLPGCHSVSQQTVQLGSCPSGTPVLANLKSIATHASAHCMLQRARKHIERWSHDMQTVMRQQHDRLSEIPCGYLSADSM